MIYNDNSKDPNKTAWCTTLHPCNEVFIEVHAAIAHKLGNLLSQPAGQAPGLARLRFVVRGPHSFIKKLWDFVPGDSITKEWQFYVDNLQVKRLHSATFQMRIPLPDICELQSQASLQRGPLFKSSFFFSTCMSFQL